MLTVRIITFHGDLIIVQNAAKVVYVKTCPYLDHEFQTEDPRKVFCCTSHSVMFSKKKKNSN